MRIRGSTPLVSSWESRVGAGRLTVGAPHISQAIAVCSNRHGATMATEVWFESTPETNAKAGERSRAPEPNPKPASIAYRIFFPPPHHLSRACDVAATRPTSVNVRTLDGSRS
jgi:hypothetical protein